MPEECCYYLAFIVDRHYTPDEEGIPGMDAVVDLLEGPFDDVEKARRLCDNMTAYLPQRISQYLEKAVTRLAVVKVTPDMVERYNLRHPHRMINYPPHSVRAINEHLAEERAREQDYQNRYRRQKREERYQQMKERIT
jgi:hypothetical protein